MIAFYKPKQGEVALEKGQVIDFLGKTFYFKGLDSGNVITAKNSLMKLKMSLRAAYGAKSLEQIMGGHIDEPLGS